MRRNSSFSCRSYSIETCHYHLHLALRSARRTRKERRGRRRTMKMKMMKSRMYLRKRVYSKYTKNAVRKK